MQGGPLPLARAPGSFANGGSWRVGKIGFIATAVKKLDLKVGELIEVAGRRYEVVSDREGRVILEPAITPVSELYPQRGWEPASGRGLRAADR
jgi:hypothetical protein